MTTIKMILASGLVALLAHAVVPELSPKSTDCPVIECAPKEAIE